MFGQNIKYGILIKAGKVSKCFIGSLGCCIFKYIKYTLPKYLYAIFLKAALFVTSVTNMQVRSANFYN